MNKILLSLFLVIALMSTAWANNGWYSTLQGTASDVEQTPPPNGVTIAYNTTDHEWEFNYGLAPAGGTTGTCLEKNSNSDYDYSWVTCSGGGGGSSQWTGIAPGDIYYNQGNVGIGFDTQGYQLFINSALTSNILAISNTNNQNAEMDFYSNNESNFGSIWSSISDSNFHFSSGNNIVFTPTANTIFSSGNVGIGSTVPGQALDVNGTIRMTGILLPTNANAGYVLTSSNVGIGTWMQVAVEVQGQSHQ